MNTKRIVLTGGHLTPALALIEIFQKENWDIHYFGRTYAMQGDTQPSLESQLIPQKNIKFYSLNTGRFRRHVDLENIIDIGKIFIGVTHALLLLIKIRPRIVVSFGGYLGLPTVIAAWLLRIPAIIHEQISAAGLANRLSAPFATKIAISFPSSRKYYPQRKTVLTGNPIQSGIFKTDQIIAKKYTKNFQHKHTILITCGNQGSKIINQTILNALPELLKIYNIMHQIGIVEAQNPEWEQAQKIQNRSYLPLRFIPHTDMGTIYSSSDLVICRSGANTISELGALQKPAITIPIPNSLMNEQLKNAQLFQKSGLGTLIHQTGIKPKTLIKQINYIFKNQSQFKLKKKYQNIFSQKGAENLQKLIIKTLRP
jgi:UDP-N-acetylglucosamine--N-acetylmuramyl-(pentapeptide) pyrophosphoryl-undecaprenol N-acetylglucosamine transferase